MPATIEMMRAVTKAARTVSYPTIALSFRPECRNCPPYLDRVAVETLITEFTTYPNGNRTVRWKTERETFFG